MTWVELLERDDELRLLGRAWQEARGGEGSIVLLAGESGIGKTSLARLFAAGPDVGEVLWGVCDPLGVPRPLGPLHDVADDLGEPAAGLLGAGAPPHEIHRALLDALTARSVLLVVDDLQWADEATIDLLRFLLRRIAGTRSLVLATYRADEPDRPAGAARPARGRRAHAVGDARRARPAVVAAVTTLVGARHIDPAHLHRLTRGNSFFVTEVVSQDGDAPARLGPRRGARPHRGARRRAPGTWPTCSPAPPGPCRTPCCPRSGSASARCARSTPPG